MNKTILFVGLLLTGAIGNDAQDKAYPRFTGPYLGQKPPGNTPEIFAPGIVPSAEFIDFKGAFSPDGKECCFYCGTD